MSDGGALLLSLTGIVAAHALAVVSPGPSFVLIARRSAALSRRDGIVCALGMGMGATIWAAGAMYGLQAVLARFGWLYVALQVLGGLFLIYVAILTWRHAGDPLPASGSGDVGRPGIMTSLTLGLVTQLSNPKVVLFFSSIFLALLPVPTPLWLQATILVLIFLVDGGWYVLVALAFSNAVLRAGYERTKRTADRLAGGLLGVLGLRLLTGIRF